MGDYDYANARLRALKSQLFDARAYAAFLGLARVDDLSARLVESPFADEIKAALARYTGARVVTEACRLNLSKTFQTVRGFFDDDGARLVGVLLARWDLFNVKTILRGQAAGARPEEMLDALVPVGGRGLDESALRTLVRQPDAAATVDLLRTWNVPYAREVQNAFGAFTRTRDWSAFETALDAIFYAHALGMLKPERTNDDLVREFLAREIDALNVMTALRLRGRARLPEPETRADTQFFLRGGALSVEWLVDFLRAQPDDDALARLRASRLHSASEGIDQLDPAQIQRALDRALARFGISFFQRDPLTIATAIGFITAKQVEVKNLRVLAQGLALNLEKVEIQQELILI
jgi:V/A-type H+-transporting ATPase subunit C